MENIILNNITVQMEDILFQIKTSVQREEIAEKLRFYFVYAILELYMKQRESVKKMYDVYDSVSENELNSVVNIYLLGLAKTLESLESYTIEKKLICTIYDVYDHTSEKGYNDINNVLYMISKISATTEYEDLIKTIGKVCNAYCRNLKIKYNQKAIITCLEILSKIANSSSIRKIQEAAIEKICNICNCALGEEHSKVFISGLQTLLGIDEIKKINSFIGYALRSGRTKTILDYLEIRSDSSTS